MSWSPPTLASERGLDPTAVVKCPECQRRVPAGAVYSLRHVPLNVQIEVWAKAWTRSRGSFGCDACLSRLHRQGLLPRADWIEHSGGPPELALKVRQAEQRRRGVV